MRFIDWIAYVFSSDLLVLEGQGVGEFQQAAGGDSCHRTVARSVIVIREDEVPATHAVVRQAIEEIVRQLRRQLHQPGIARVAPAKREAVYAPCLASRPTAVVGKALMRAAVPGTAGSGIAIEGVKRRSIRADQQPDRKSVV